MQKSWTPDDLCIRRRMVHRMARLHCSIDKSGRLSNLPRIRLCERFNRESSWVARNLPGWISRLNFVPRDLRRIASGASHRDIAEVLVGEAPSTPVPRRLLRPYADCPECTCSSEKAPQPAPCVSRRTVPCSRSLQSVRPVDMAANSLAGAHRFKSRVDAEKEICHLLYAGIVGAGVEDAQVNGGMLPVVS